MVEVSRDGRRCMTNSLYAVWDDILPDGVGAWMAKLDADVDSGGLERRPGVLPQRRRLLRVHQTRLQGGDASSDSYCFTG